MVGADVTIRYEFLPTEGSIKESAERVVKQLNKSVGKPISVTTGKKLANEFDKTTNSIINLLRATQQKTSLQTKILSGMKFLEGKGITGGAGIGGGEAAGGAAAGGIAGGGMIAALGTIAALLVIIAVAMTLISAFFDAVGPIIKVVVKMISAMILILLMPFLKRGLPILFGILKWMIQMSKGISNFVEQFFTYMEKLIGRALGGDPMAFLELMVGPLGMLFIFLSKKLIEFLAGIDWGAVAKSVIPMLESAFTVIKDAIKGFTIAVFGEETWEQIKNAIKFIQTVLAPEGLWETVKGVIDDIGKEIFGEAIWNNIKSLINTAKDYLITALTSAAKAIQEAATAIVNWWNANAAWLFGKELSAPADTTMMEMMLRALSITPVGGGGGKSVAEWVNEQNKIPYGQQRVPIPGGGYETKDERDARVKAGMGDFISRPGTGIIPFSSTDTIIGTKTPGGIGGVNITNNLNVSAGVDKSEFRKILTEFSRQQERDFRGRTSYYGG